MHGKRDSETFETIVIGGGQAGLSVGYHLARRRRSFVILDANERVGDSWRRRWDSLRLFTPARYAGLVGMPFPAALYAFPTKNEMADYLETYAARFELPVRTGVKVDRLSRHEGRYVVNAGDRRFEAEHVVVAMATYQIPRVPPFGRELNPGIVQMHSFEYRNPSQLQDGPVLVVGAGNSGAEIAVELARSHRVWVSGRDTGHVPFKIESLARRLFTPFVLRVLFHRVLTVRTPIGRRVRPKLLRQGGPLIRVRPNDLAASGVERTPRMAGARGGLPLLEDGRVLDVTNVIWCTGFEPGFSWIDLPVVEQSIEPKHVGGVAVGEPGLYFVGLHFLYALSSTMIHGVGRDAERIVDVIDARIRASEPAKVRSNRASASLPHRSSPAT